MGRVFTPRTPSMYYYKVQEAHPRRMEKEVGGAVLVIYNRSRLRFVVMYVNAEWTLFLVFPGVWHTRQREHKAPLYARGGIQHAPQTFLRFFK